MNQVLNSTDRKNCYQILAALFNYPEQELLENLSPCLDELSTLLELPITPELNKDISLTDLEVAYTGLFINRLGGAPAPPYGSIYLEAEGQLMGASCLRVAEYYQGEGLNMDGSDEPADFLPTELEFLYYLAAEEEAAEDRQEELAASNLRQKQVTFGQELLHPWLTIFCKRIKKSDDGHPLYTWAADALNRFSALELNQAKQPD